MKIYNKQVYHCLLNRGIKILVGKRIIGNKDSSLGTVLDLKYALSNNLLKTEVEELLAA